MPQSLQLYIVQLVLEEQERSLPLIRYGNVNLKCGSMVILFSTLFRITDDNEPSWYKVLSSITFFIKHAVPLYNNLPDHSTRLYARSLNPELESRDQLNKTKKNESDILFV
jgi:hypothetical protein